MRDLVVPLPKSLSPLTECYATKKGGSYPRGASLEGFLENSETAQLSRLLSNAVIKIIYSHNIHKSLPSKARERSQL